MSASDEAAAFAAVVISIAFDWDELNISHLAKHEINPLEAEQVILNRPIDLSSELRNGEERICRSGKQIQAGF